MQRILKLVALTFATSALATPHLGYEEAKPLWQSWKSIHDKAYNLAEEGARFAIFVANYRKVASLNAENNGVKYALNKFSDLTSEEFKAVYATGYNADMKTEQNNDTDISGLFSYEFLTLPKSVDWREKGAVTPVKNQAQCGSCWSFSSTGALEGLHAIKTGKLVSFSEQQLVDCDKVDAGCNGGLPQNAFDYTAKHGITTEADYPYTGQDNRCQFDASKAIKVNTGKKSVTANSAAALKAALAVQPVAIGIEADQDVFQFYESGVLKSKDCGAELDHAVLAVGYTVVNGEEAFIVKNSWGPTWGKDGYIYISTDGSSNNGAGVCGILGDPAYPTM